MLAILTLFYTPLTIISKILIIELIAASYLFTNARHDIHWRDAAALILATLLTIPLGQWLLLETDPQLMRRAIATIILLCAVVMLLGYRYPQRLGLSGMIAVGLIGGLVFGASYIALVVVAAILLGPYNKTEVRTLMIAWAFASSVWFAAIAAIGGAVTPRDVVIALPAAVTYFAGTWLGSRYFRRAAEDRYRQFALVTLLVLAILSFLK